MLLISIIILKLEVLLKYHLSCNSARTNSYKHILENATDTGGLINWVLKTKEKKQKAEAWEQMASMKYWRRLLFCNVFKKQSA